MKRIFDIKRTTLAGLLALTLGVVTTPPAAAAPLGLTDVPLFIDLAVEPNIVVSIDDSGSMEGCDMVRKGISSSRVENNRGMTAKPTNGLAYDPNIQYLVPRHYDGNEVNYLAQTSFTAAYLDAYNPSAGKVDLSNASTPSGPGSNYKGFRPCWDSLTDFRSSPLAAQAAYYHTFSGDPKLNTSTGAGVGNQANYTQIVVGSAADLSVFDGQAGESNLEKQNFANFFSYYRNRLLAMKSAAGLAFVDPALGGRVRIAQQTLWGLNGDDGGKRTDISLMKLFGKQGDTNATALANRQAFFNWLYAIQNTGGTPLRYTLDKAGRYYMNQIIDSPADSHGYKAMPAINSPWAFEPGVTKDPEFTCRQAFHVLMTDGQWNNDAGRLGNIDNTGKAYPVPVGGVPSYTPISPYKDSTADQLADNAFYYWINDLRTDLANDVPTYMPDPTLHPITSKAEDNPKNDPATWQHMVNFTVGFGVNGTLDPGSVTTYNALVDGSQSWSSDRVDDLWHAAINSRGTYVSAEDPQQLVNAFSAALNSVLARTSSGAGVAQSSGELTTGSQFFQGRFNSGNWTGQLLAFDLNDTTGFVETPETWDAAIKLDAQVAGSGWNTGRTVLTFNGTPVTGGIPFRWASLPGSMQTELNKNDQGIADAVGNEKGDKRLEYLRGSAADEGSNGNQWRARASKLGDIITSAPTFVGAPAFGYDAASGLSGAEKSNYATFKANTSRTPMVYVGANGGMLHGFDATPGKPAPANAGTEKLAYVPKAVFPRLTRLTATNYAHRFFVDGSPTAGDAFWGGAWHTVLVGGLNKGGQGMYALDVTDPSSFNESNASSLVLWEYTDANDKDLGYTFSRPSIARTQAGWAAIFGNGYNNTESDAAQSPLGRAVLYVLDIEDGSVIRKIDTTVGWGQDPTGTGRPNGLATVSPVDVDQNGVIDLVYAGDLFGNLWKFDLRDTNPINWNATKLFTAMDGDSPAKAQPITVRPEVGLHPQSGKPGYMIYFGTGKYLESGDNITTNTQTQTFWGIWDPDSGVPPYARSNLLQQQILEEVPVNVNGVLADVRITTDNAINWAADPMSPGSGHLGWYMDLVNTAVTPLNNKGERQVTSALLRNGRIIFTTLIPSGSSCVFGGDGWLMELDAADGSQLGTPPFDIDGDGVFDLVSDSNGNAVPPSGIKSRVGAPSEPSVLDRGDGTEVKTISGSSGGALQQEIESNPPPPPGSAGRESWQQLR